MRKCLRTYVRWSIAWEGESVNSTFVVKVYPYFQIMSISILTFLEGLLEQCFAAQVVIQRVGDLDHR